MELENTTGPSFLLKNLIDNQPELDNKVDHEILECVSWRDINRQILVTNIGFLFTIHAGVNLTFTNLFLGEFDTNASSWLASIVGLSVPFGACSCGIFMDKYGRKQTNLMITIPCVISYFLTSLVNTDQLVLLYVARFLSGIAAGLTTSNLVYVSEISHKKFRPLFLSLISVYFSTGILLTTVLQLILSWRECAFIYAIFFIAVAILVFILTPESPIWLINFRNDYDNAKKSVMKLYSNPKIFESEWHWLITNTRSKTEVDAHKRVKYSGPAIYKPLSCLSILFLLQQLSGIYLTILYAIYLFPTLSPTEGEVFKNEAFVIFGVIRFVASVNSSLLSVHVGRKTLLQISSIGMAICCLPIACSSYLNSWGLYYEIINLFSLIMYVGAGSFGMMTVPWTLIVELLPTEMKSIGGTFLISYSYILISISAKMFPFVLKSVGAYFVFGFFGFICLLSVLFVYLFIPETLGKTFKEIEEHFEKGNCDGK